MPWIKDDNGEQKYKLSIYAKEELPTWSEIYDEWLKNNMLIYNPQNPEHQTLDPYWKIPHRKYLIAVVCNQLNKMIFEGGLRNSVIQMLNKEFPFDGLEAWDIRFICENLYPTTPMTDQEATDYMDKVSSKFYFPRVKDETMTPIAPPIYTIPLPSGEKNPFALSSKTRIDVNSLNEKLAVNIVINMYNSDGYLAYTLDASPLLYGNNSDVMKSYGTIIGYILRDIVDYFQNGIGWKDEDGKIITTGRETINYDIKKDFAL